MLPPICDESLTLLLLSSPVLPTRDLRLPFDTGGRGSDVEVASTSAGWTGTVEVDASAFTASGAGVADVGSSATGVATGVDKAGEFRLILGRLWVDHKPCIDRFSAFEPYLSACEQPTRVSESYHIPISP